jgi:hypothetical protein
MKRGRCRRERCTVNCFGVWSESFGAWLSLARAPGSGPGGRWFKSTRPDQFISKKFSNFALLSFRYPIVAGGSPKPQLTPFFPQ